MNTPHSSNAVNNHDLDRFFSGETDEKITTMEELYALHHEVLLQDNIITDSLALIKEYCRILARQMLAMHLDQLCTACAGQKGGGCCSSYMEANSDVILLLINRLQGVAVCRQHEQTEECCFLGSRGCILPVKPIFCLNYNCIHIHNRSNKTEISTLEHLTGRLLTEQTRLEALLLRKIKNKPCTAHY